MHPSAAEVMAESTISLDVRIASTALSDIRSIQDAP